MGWKLKKIIKKTIDQSTNKQNLQNKGVSTNKQNLLNKDIKPITNVTYDYSSSTSAVPVKDETIPANNVANTSAVPASAENDLGLYINDLRNRRKKRGAPQPELARTLGSTGALGV